MHVNEYTSQWHLLCDGVLHVISRCDSVDMYHYADSSNNNVEDVDYLYEYFKTKSIFIWFNYTSGKYTVFNNYAIRVFLILLINVDKLENGGGVNHPQRIVTVSLVQRQKDPSLSGMSLCACRLSTTFTIPSRFKHKGAVIYLCT